jgi:hypothetical protein
VRLPKKITEDFARIVYQSWQTSGLPLAKLFPVEKDYRKIRLALVDLGLMGNQPRAERLSASRASAKLRRRRATTEKNARTAQLLNEALRPLTCHLMDSQTLCSSSAPSTGTA